MRTHETVAVANRAVSLPEPRLVQAAHEFEAQMMKELLKPMTSGTIMNGDESDSGSGGALGDFATEALGQSLSRLGGLGIATSILRSISPDESTSLISPETGALARRVP